MESPAVNIEAIFHKAIKRFLSKRQQGFTMDAFRNVMRDYNITAEMVREAEAHAPQFPRGNAYPRWEWYANFYNNAMRNPGVPCPCCNVTPDGDICDHLPPPPPIWVCTVCCDSGRMQQIREDGLGLEVVPCPQVGCPARQLTDLLVSSPMALGAPYQGAAALMGDPYESAAKLIFPKKD
jgi:hypothetical protein